MKVGSRLRRLSLISLIYIIIISDVDGACIRRRKHIGGARKNEDIDPIEPNPGVNFDKGSLAPNYLRKSPTNSEYVTLALRDETVASSNLKKADFFIQESETPVDEKKENLKASETEEEKMEYADADELIVRESVKGKRCKQGRNENCTDSEKNSQENVDNERDENFFQGVGKEKEMVFSGEDESVVNDAEVKPCKRGKKKCPGPEEVAKENIVLDESSVLPKYDVMPSSLSDAESEEKRMRPPNDKTKRRCRGRKCLSAGDSKFNSSGHKVGMNIEHKDTASEVDD